MVAARLLIRIITITRSGAASALVTGVKLAMEGPLVEWAALKK